MKNENNNSPASQPNPHKTLQTPSHSLPSSRTPASRTSSPNVSNTTSTTSSSPCPCAVEASTNETPNLVAWSQSVFGSSEPGEVCWRQCRPYVRRDRDSEECIWAGLKRKGEYVARWVGLRRCTVHRRAHASLDLRVQRMPRRTIYHPYMSFSYIYGCFIIPAVLLDMTH
jgi:hypothetical protein